MKISKYVSFEQEVEIDIDLNDVRYCLAEAFARVEQSKHGEEPTRRDVLSALNRIASFLNALTDEQIVIMTPGQTKMIGEYLATQAARFAKTLPEVTK